MNSRIEHNGQCSCGAVGFRTIEPAIFRAFCHCTICQRFNTSSYADVTVFFSNDIILRNESKIEYKVHKNPPLVRRGTCVECGKPAIEKINIPLMPKLIIVPSRNMDNIEDLPPPSLHIFYDKRVSDIDDGLRKYHGYLLSQVGFALGLMKGMMSRSQSKGNYQT